MESTVTVAIGNDRGGLGRADAGENAVEFVGGGGVEIESAGAGRGSDVDCGGRSGLRRMRRMSRAIMTGERSGSAGGFGVELRQLLPVTLALDVNFVRAA